MAKPLIKQLDELTALYGPKVRNAFMSTVNEVKGSVVIKDLVTAIKDGNIEGAIRQLGLSEEAMRPITAALEQAYEAGGNVTAKTFPRLPDGTGLRTVFRFNIRNSRAERWIRERSSTLVTRVTNDQREAIKTLLFEGIKSGRNPRNVALDIIGRIDPATGRRTGGIVGLTVQQERAVARARRELATPAEIGNWFNRKRRDKRFDSIVRKAIAKGEPLDAETINRLVGKYSDNLLKLRGENIGRTEALQSLNQASHEAFKQVVESGAVKQSNVKRIWDSAGADGRTRDSHLAMDGQMVGMDEAFTTPSGQKLMFPGDSSLGAGAEEIINCRCVVRTDVDWLAEGGMPPVASAPAPVVPPPAPVAPTLPPITPPPSAPFPAWQKAKPTPLVKAATPFASLSPNVTEYLKSKGIQTPAQLPDTLKFENGKLFGVFEGELEDVSTSVLDVSGYIATAKINAEKAAIAASLVAKQAELAALKNELENLTVDPNADNFDGMIYSEKIKATHAQLPDFVPRENYTQGLTKYVASDYTEMNRYLRRGEVEYYTEADLVRWITQVRSHMRPTKLEYKVFRGVRPASFNPVQGLGLGDTFTMDGLTSVSRSSVVSMNFAGQKGILFKFTLPRGTNAVTTNSGEAELILDHGHKFQIIKIEQPTSEFEPTVYTVEMID